MPPRHSHHGPITLATISGFICLILPAVSLVRTYMSTGSVLPVVYIALVSSATFLLFGYDKMQARNLGWRVRETTLHTCALIGGWPGALIGMHYFQHKTRKTGFLVQFWGIVVGWQVIAWVLWTSDYVTTSYHGRIPQTTSD